MLRRIEHSKWSYKLQWNDDLTKEILQWLPPEDKIVLSGVSQQFDACLAYIRNHQKVLQIETKTSVRFIKHYRSSQTIILRNEVREGLGFPKPLLNDIRKLILNFPNVTHLITDFYSLVNHNHYIDCPLEIVRRWRNLASIKTTWGNEWIRKLEECEDCIQERDRKRLDTNKNYFVYR